MQKCCIRFTNRYKYFKNNLENKSELCNYLIKRFYNDGYHGIQESRTIWNIVVVAYMINRKWFIKKEINCQNIKQDISL